MQCWTRPGPPEPEAAPYLRGGQQPSSQVLLRCQEPGEGPRAVGSRQDVPGKVSKRFLLRAADPRALVGGREALEVLFTETLSSCLPQCPLLAS